MAFEDDLAAAQTPEDRYIDVLVLINSKPYTLRFRAMDGIEWAAETDRHPARPGVLVDARYGYNLRSLIRAAAPRCGVLVDGDEERTLRVDPIIPETPGMPPQKRVDEWADVFKAISGHEFQRVTDAIWSLNEYFPQQEIEAAGKALADSANTSN
ncbi:hypothetical protein [Curtobacterium sp. ISL-83]|uniref:hypothetical protein n=1 Tax=Curtobacterium sp. ISL-83 TaxID=2819145 RepID=UPI001BE684EF|nr:hypothetical protein [Curtobacterium sp. ISL-83]MBT2502978.1 hypothetical protein [Curtobacterium sp. ISL-83]